MKICIVGGGKIGYYLAKTMLEHGHIPVIIEDNFATCEHIADALDIRVIDGDGSRPEVLKTALDSKEPFHSFVAVTGKDETNLIACQIAKRVYKVKRTVARVNNPKNTSVLKKLGVDIVVSSTDNIARLIEREVEAAAMRHLLSLDGGTTSLSQIEIPQSFPYHDETLAELPVPGDVVVISVTRKGEFEIPRGNTKIMIGDKVTILAKNEAFSKLVKTWHLQEDSSK